MLVNEFGVLASLCRASFFDFVKEFWTTIIQEPPVLNWHVQYLCEELQIVAERVFANKPKEYDLIINVPPGSTKSTICSQMFPAWCWTRAPHTQLIHISYAHAIALKDSIRCRDVVQSDLYKKCFPGILLREDENTKGLFMNTQRGYRLSVGMGGAITGQHGHFLVVDDPINPEEAFSEAELRNANRWMESTLPTRKVNKEVTVTILIQQRLHQGDPTGEILERSHGKGIKHINLPGELTPNVSPKDLASRYKDGLLDPIRLSRRVLDQMRVDIGEFAYAAQILQEPVPLGGGMFKTDQIHMMKVEPDKWLRLIRSWDKAGTKDGGAYSVGALMGLDSNWRYWILDIKRGQWSSAEREKKIADTAEEDGVDVEVIVEAEGGSGGKESAERTVEMLRKKTIRAIALHPTGEKEVRAYQLSVEVGNGNVYCVGLDSSGAELPWAQEMKKELRFFPFSKYKDQVDALSQAFNRIYRKRVRAGGMRLAAK